MCLDCNEIITVGNTGSDGWSPVLALYEGTCGETSVTVQQLVSWIDGSGTKPDYNGDIMTDAWLAANPIYIGATGFVTDICDAVPLGGSAGTPGATGPTGATGPQGPQGDPGCTPIADLTFEFTNNGEALDPAVEYTVDIDNTDPCAPIYSVSIDANDLFTNTGLVNAFTSTTTFTNILNDLPALNPTPTIKKNTDSVNPLSIGTTNEDIQYINFGSVSTIPSFGSWAPSWIEWSIIGNKMYLNFEINIRYSDPGPSGNGAGIQLLMVIPNNEKRLNVYEKNSITIISPSYTNNGLNYVQWPGIITTSYTNDRFLTFGTFSIAAFTNTVGSPTLPTGTFYPGILTTNTGRDYIYTGQITFTIQ